MTTPLMVKFKRVEPDALLPTRETELSVGLDLYAYVGGTLAPGRRAVVRTGVKVDIPPGHELQVRPRSGLAAKYGVTVLNSPGTVDADYRGEVKVILINHGEEPFEWGIGDRIAQIVFAKPVCVEPVEELGNLSETKRGEGGFGSTGR